jgi:hypothetical protein
LFEQVWGYRPAAFDPQFADINGVTAGKRTEYGKANNAPYYRVDEVLGREVYMPIELIYDDETQDNGTVQSAGIAIASGPSGSLKSIYLPNAIVCGDIHLSKTVVDTALTERRGSVSELITINNFRIQVKGCLINPVNEFPEDLFTAMNSLFESCQPVQVNNVVTDILFQRFGGSRLATVRNLRFYQSPGVKHVVPYELELVSELPFSLLEIV